LIRMAEHRDRISRLKSVSREAHPHQHERTYAFDEPFHGISIVSNHLYPHQHVWIDQLIFDNRTLNRDNLAHIEGRHAMMRKYQGRTQQKRKGSNKSNSPPDFHGVTLPAKEIHSVPQSLTADYTHPRFFKYTLKNNIGESGNPPPFSVWTPRGESCETFFLIPG